jgi:ribonuclease BN (tRNA processing enzyme)
MFIEVVGASGSKNAVDRIVCMKLGSRALIDAGSASFIPYEELRNIDVILLTHAHLDHILDLGFVLDSLVTCREKPVQVLGSEACLSIVRTHYMNGLIWPDFTRIRSGDFPVLEYRPIEDYRWTSLPGGVEAMPVPVNHPAGARGFIFRSGGDKVVYSGDTGPTEALWETAASMGGVKALFIEVSFPESMRGMALAADHLSPSLAAGEIAKLRMPGVPVHLFHMKPWFADEIRGEAGIIGPGVRFLKTGDRIEFGGSALH